MNLQDTDIFPRAGDWRTTPNPPLKPLFRLGVVVTTPGAIDAIHEAGAGVAELIRRHVTGDWTEMSEYDQNANREAVEVGARVFSAYTLEDGVKIWIITEWDRSATTLLLPSEY